MIKSHVIPVCYFPTSVVFLDDSKDFLMNLSLHFESDFPYQIFDSQADVIELIKQNTLLPRLRHRCLSESMSSAGDPSTNQTIHLNLAAIHEEMYNPDRFKEISCLFVDYSMPGMNGLEVCKQLQDVPVKKILLTGQADEKIGIEAFNQGLIDAFINKNNPDAVSSLKAP